MIDDAISAAEQIAATLEELGVPYMVDGSMASSLWGEPRFTRDVDVVAAPRDEHVPGLIAALGDRWYADEVLIRGAIARRSSFNVIRLERMVKVDVFVPPDGGFHASKFERARRAPLNVGSERTVAVTSPEDIVLQKLEWFRSGGEVSDQQWRDVVGLLRTLGAALDENYLGEWAQRLGLDRLLERARADSRA